MKKDKHIILLQILFILLKKIIDFIKKKTNKSFFSLKYIIFLREY